jgi:hypothetical protein
MPQKSESQIKNELTLKAIDEFLGNRKKNPFGSHRQNMNVIKGWKILQIVAAQAGWKAVYCQESEYSQVKISNRVIICWALVEAIGADDALRTEVRGIVQESNHLAVVGDLITTDKIGDHDVNGNQYFLGYNDPEAHKESDYWLKQANVWLKTEKAKRAK